MGHLLCDRCRQPKRDGPHGLYRCPLEPDPTWQHSAIGGRDKMWEFQSVHLPGMPQITSKSHWKRELKARGMTDDYTRKEIATAARTPRRGTQNLRQRARQIAEGHLAKARHLGEVGR